MTSGGGFKRRDVLREIEKSTQEVWSSRDAYQSDASDDGREKFFVTFPYPYMNGRLHLGHAFSLTKAEFTARFQRLLGKNVLWPFGFHCTGMPILACADKLKRELAEGGAEAAAVNGEGAEVVKEQSEEDLSPSSTDPTKFATKRSKAVAKTGGLKRQWDIMLSMGVPPEEIPKFTRPDHWFSYFSPIAQTDLNKFGVAVDWRRSFITTDRNAYYDSFVRWQFLRLRERGYIKFGMRPAVFSPTDGQPCMDHDRATGEGVGPQEYSVIKMEIQNVPTAWVDKCPEIAGRRVFLVAATLRPETMYGQTNCFVLPEGKYGMHLAFDRAATDRVSSRGICLIDLDRPAALAECRDVFVCSSRAADNMCHQGVVPSLEGRPHTLFEVLGQELVGLPLSAPLCAYPTIYALPMLTVSMDKGTGVVCSVPSDAPDDYVALKELQDKPKLRDTYHVKEEWTAFDIVEIIEIPGLGKRAAVDLSIAKKITSQKDKQKLAEVKDEVYRRGFYEGVMLVGPHKGRKVGDAKTLVRADLVEQSAAFRYFEPERKVQSRSGDDCIVALCNQWYLTYGADEWRHSVESHVASPATFATYNDRMRNQLLHVVDWLKEWACSRSYGVGTSLPWDPKTLIESLSDSTIYMAYYTVAHFLHADLYGKVPGTLDITADKMTPEVWDYVTGQTDKLPENIEKSHAEKMRREFEYWYPMDLRVSGKDLLFNHLTFALYNHAAMWPGRAADRWPRGYFCNGHIMVDAEKMSKSTGNFLTLEEAIVEYTADGTRIALADAGDGLEDANFQRESGNAALMRLYLLTQFVEEALMGQQRAGDKLLADLMFEAVIADLCEKARNAYEQMQFRDALKFSFFDFSAARDAYRQICGSKGFHKDTIKMFVETQAVVLCPIAPHVCEHIWQKSLKNESLVVNASWPSFATRDPMLVRQWRLLFNSLDDFRRSREKAKSGKKGKTTEGAEVARVVIYVAAEYFDWQRVVLQILQELEVDVHTNRIVNEDFMGFVKSHPALQAIDKKMTKDAMAFASYRVKEDFPKVGREAFDLGLLFDEKKLFEDQKEFVGRALDVQIVDVLRSDEEDHPADNSQGRVRKASTPGKASVLFC